MLETVEVERAMQWRTIPRFGPSRTSTRLVGQTREARKLAYLIQHVDQEVLAIALQGLRARGHISQTVTNRAPILSNSNSHLQQLRPSSPLATYPGS